MKRVSDAFHIPVFNPPGPAECDGLRYRVANRMNGRMKGFSPGRRYPFFIQMHSPARAALCASGLPSCKPW
jgi:hypothetical protein